MTPDYAAEDQSLWAALDANTEELRELVYSNPEGMYVRSSAGWFRLPDDDLTLDGLESIDVDESFIDVFDAAEQERKKITREEILEYEVPDPDVDADVDVPVAEEGS